MRYSIKKKKYDKINAGDEVKVLSYGQKGEVLELVGEDEAVVQMGIMHTAIEAHLLMQQPAEPP